MSYIRWFHDQESQSVQLVGGKAANLGRLTVAGFPVPPGFCVSALAYRYVMDITGLSTVVSHNLAKVDFDDPDQIALQAAAIRELIAQQPIPTAIALEVLENYHQLAANLGLHSGSRLAVAVRSSATAEDLPDASFAGQQDTFLNVRGGEAVLEHVRQCWASLWTDRAISYRHQHGYDHNEVNVAVVIQSMVDAEVSGILFTANPVNGRRDQCVINAAPGLGEAIVSGHETPDTLILDKLSGKVLRRHAGTSSSAESGSPAIDDRQAGRLVALCSRIEAHYGQPQDIEWALSGENWHILQARPITTLATAPDSNDIPEGRYSRAMFREIFLDGLSPAFLSVVSPLLADMLAHALQSLGFQPPNTERAIVPYHNQPYLSVDYIEEALASLPADGRREMAARFVNVFEDVEAAGHDAGLTLSQARILFRMMRFVRDFHRSLSGQLEVYHALLSDCTKLSEATASEKELLAAVRRLAFSGAGPLLNNDFLLIATIGTYTRLIVRLLQPSHGTEATRHANTLITAVRGNIVMETNALIWDLAQAARSDKTVAAKLRDTDPAQVLEDLTDSCAGRAFVNQLNELLQVCGHRENTLDILYPTWGEDPSPVLAFVRGYLDCDTSLDPGSRAESMAIQRQIVSAAALERVGQLLPGGLWRRPLLAWLLDQTIQLVRERDTMHFEWTRIFPPVRRLLLELGRRWSASGLIACAEDIFFLTLDEQERLATHPAPCQEIVIARRSEFERYRSGPWPDQLGFAPAAPETVATDTLPAGWLRGIGGSPGQVTGPVCVVRSRHEFAKLRPGDVLVAPLTNPAWTPLFAIAGGLVTEVGGILSHGAIVAREYGIPAVMAVAGAAGTLHDGQVITVDGDRGLVCAGATEAGHLINSSGRRIPSPKLAHPQQINAEDTGYAAAK